MENAVDALKIAFAVFVFTMAISISIYMFTLVGETADIVLQSSDVTEFMQYTEISDMIGDDRIVGLETIIPTLYKYYKENYRVIFMNSNGTPLELYETQTNPNRWSNNYGNKYYNHNEDTRICSFDLSEERSRGEPWIGGTTGTSNIKLNLDCFLSGKTFTGTNIIYDYGEIVGSGGFAEKYKNSRFRESLGEYTYNHVTSEVDSSEDSFEITNVKGRKKKVIIYTLIN